MSRSMRVAAAQLGPIARDESREQVVKRLLELMHEAADWGVDVIVYPELALTTFFPRWAIEDDAEIDSWFEAEMPNVATQPLFDEAKRLGIGFHLGYGEIAWQDNVKHRFNTAIIVDKSGEIVGKFRKIHIPGHHEVLDRPGQHLEKKYFEVGDLGFPVYQAFGASCGMAICNDRRWPETWRVMGLQGVEMVFCGYNTPVGLGDPYDIDALSLFHNQLAFQAGCHQNATWAVGVAKAGCEEGFNMIGQSMIVAPTGEIVAMCNTIEDELIVHKCDLSRGSEYKRDLFNFAHHRRPEHYGLIVERTGAEPPRDG
ncbi:MAG: N-carbamoyl-D-amino-acid hydrolase [Rhodospirillaceae bacterium]|jgi:N-carbamoyl-D-amino-acid hydrolase|nr:N-carbamoyl-D-amino-acid hydrolase [Rhodospirillaceae bacterium]MBT6202464.1 N-carbamoyl-D-amino-acid hydrolase [Rhodospirillaceae bacterium]MBT7614062.1 N-carbamoyl-D-amino-acid hydrolase [Rhodospirillaceae bacterium]